MRENILYYALKNNDVPLFDEYVCVCVCDEYFCTHTFNRESVRGALNVCVCVCVCVCLMRENILYYALKNNDVPLFDEYVCVCDEYFCTHTFNRESVRGALNVCVCVMCVCLFDEREYSLLCVEKQ